VETALQKVSTKDSNLSSSTAMSLDERAATRLLSWLLGATDEDGLQVESVVGGSNSEEGDRFLGVAASESPRCGRDGLGQGVGGGLLDS
jgi:hypothetical protein